MRLACSQWNGARRTGGLYLGIERVARGDLNGSASEKQQGMDRYATSKLVAILYVYALARGTPAGDARWFAFDPGLMPGTGLTRSRSAVESWAWSTILPVVARAMLGTSTPRRSTERYARLLGRLADSNRRDRQDEVAQFAHALAQRWRPVAAETAAR